MGSSLILLLEGGVGEYTGLFNKELYEAAPSHHWCDVEWSHYINKNKFKGGAYQR